MGDRRTDGGEKIRLRRLRPFAAFALAVRGAAAVVPAALRLTVTSDCHHRSLFTTDYAPPPGTSDGSFVVVVACERIICSQCLRCWSFMRSQQLCRCSLDSGEGAGAAPLDWGAATAAVDSKAAMARLVKDMVVLLFS